MFKRNKILMSVVLMGASLSFNQALGSITCSSILNKKPSVPMSEVYRDTVRLMVSHDLIPASFIRIHDLRQEAEMNTGRRLLVEGIERSIKVQHPDLNLTHKDSILVLDIRGDKLGILKNLGFRTIVREALDLVGLEVVQITREGLEGRSASMRIVIVIKEGAKDYREVPAQDKLTTKEDFTAWASQELHYVFSELFNTYPVTLDHNPSLEAKVYKLLGKRPGIAEGSPLEWMPKSDFIKNYNRALYQLMGGLNGAQLLFMRSSFWDQSPTADTFAKTTYETLNQGVSSDVMANTYAEKALELRERLYRSIHKTDSGSNRSSTSPVEVENTVSYSRGQGQEVHSLSGVSSQAEFGNDFFTGNKHSNIALSELQLHSNLDVTNAVEHLARHGYTEISELQGADAQQVLNRTNLSLAELIPVARELVEYGVFLRYPLSVLYKMEPAVRTELRSPKNRNFQYDVRTNTYSPRTD
jgi:hypothetical protein